MTCCSRCSRSAKRGPHSVATHYVLHFDSVVELHPIDDLREPFEPAQSSPAALGAQAELVDHREHSVAGQDILSCDRMDYFVWLARNALRTFVIDTGFNEGAASRRRRVFLRSPVDGLKLLGVDASEVEDVVITHLHYDHVGNFDLFPKACFHLQDRVMSYATG